MGRRSPYLHRLEEREKHFGVPQEYEEAAFDSLMALWGHLEREGVCAFVESFDEQGGFYLAKGIVEGRLNADSYTWQGLRDGECQIVESSVKAVTWGGGESARITQLMRYELKNGRNISSGSTLDPSLVEIYINPDDLNSFEAGRILHENGDWWTLASLSKWGEFDGYLTLRAEDVLQIGRNSRYLCRLEEMEKIGGDAIKRPTLAFDFIEAIWNHLIREKVCAYIEWYDWKATYVVATEIDGDKLRGWMYTKQGVFDGDFETSASMLKTALWGGGDSARVTRLHQAHHPLP